MSPGPNPYTMVDAHDTPLEVRLARAEKELAALRSRVVALERLVGAGELHPVDESTVEKKVRYDWQS